MAANVSSNDNNTKSWDTWLRPYVCDFCGSSYPHRKALKNHKKGHLDPPENQIKNYTEPIISNQVEAYPPEKLGSRFDDSIPPHTLNSLEGKHVEAAVKVKSTPVHHFKAAKLPSEDSVKRDIIPTLIVNPSQKGYKEQVSEEDSDKDFSSDSLSDHFQSLNITSSCELCSKEFTTREELVSHLLGFHSYYMCVQCLEIFGTSDLLKVHVQNDHGPPLVCQSTSKNVHQAKRFSCLECSMDFNKRPEYKRHLKAFHAIPCPVCTKRMLKERISKHVQKFHTPTKCPTCHITYPDRRMMKTHEKKEHSVECELCNIKLVSLSRLERHMLKAHSKDLIRLS